MASLQQEILKVKGNHTVGHIASTSQKLRTVMNGGIVKVTAPTVNVEGLGKFRNGIDNYTVAQIKRDPAIAGDADMGVVVEKTSEAVGDATSYNLVLVATPEERLEGEPLSNFFNAHGDRATLYPLNQYIAFSTSKYTVDSGDPKIGDFAYWDTATDTLKIVANNSDPQFTSAPVKFQVIDFEDDTYYTIDDSKLVTVETLI